MTIRAAGSESSGGSTRQCAGDGGAYTVHYPASWFTVDHGPMPCRFFHPEPFTLLESTEAPGLAIQVQLAPAPFDAIVPPLHDPGSLDETLSSRSGFLAGGRTARIDSRTRSAGILPARTRRLTWYLEAGQQTLVATTSARASAGSFASNADVLDDIVAALEFWPMPSAPIFNLRDKAVNQLPGQRRQFDVRRMAVSAVTTTARTDTLTNCDATALPFPDNSYDAVLC